MKILYICNITLPNIEVILLISPRGDLSPDSLCLSLSDGYPPLRHPGMDHCSDYLNYSASTTFIFQYTGFTSSHPNSNNLYITRRQFCSSYPYPCFQYLPAAVWSTPLVPEQFSY